MGIGTQAVDRLLAEFGSRTRATRKVTAWDISQTVGIVLETDSAGDDWTHVWVPHLLREESIPRFARVYRPGVGRHSNTYASPGLERGKPALRLRIGTSADLNRAIAFIREVVERGAALSTLKPTTRARVIDLVREAGHDASDWANFKGGAAKAAVNPKYCYEWAFTQAGRCVVLNLWYESMVLDGDIITQRLRLRTDRNRGKSIWTGRAKRLSAAIALAARDRLAVRVIACDGRMRQTGGRDAEASRVTRRVLDPVVWAVASHDPSTGESVLQRAEAPTAAKQDLTTASLRKALSEVLPHIGHQQLAMLRAHYYLPSRTASMQDLALAGGYEEYRAANVQYGRLCGLVCRALGFQSPGDNIYAIATLLPIADEHGHYLWHLDDAAAQSLEELGVVDPTARQDTVLDAAYDDELRSVSETTRQELRDARIGQGKFRARLLAYWNGCSVTGVARCELLNASHIVPWKNATNAERLDPSNGLLLTPNLDRLFDRHLITFDEDGKIRMSVRLDQIAQKHLGLTGAERLRLVSPRLLRYLDRHRARFDQMEAEKA